MILVVGGAGFVGLNVLEALAAAGRPAAVLDRTPLPDPALAVHAVVGDVTDPAAVAAAFAPGIEAVVLGAALTAGPAREAADPEGILRVNLAGPVAVLREARRAGVRRVVNLSSAAAYGAVEAPALRENGPAEPAGLYAITKLASEQVGTRLGALWGLDVRHVRLSAVFGPWERDTGARDTLSAPWQIVATFARGAPALLPRPGRRDWLYAPDAARAILAVLDAPAPAHALYNVTTGIEWTALAWGEALARHWPGAVCRLAEPGEAPTIDLHGEHDRPMMDGTRLRDGLGWRALFDLESSAADMRARANRPRHAAAASVGGTGIADTSSIV